MTRELRRSTLSFLTFFGFYIANLFAKFCPTQSEVPIYFIAITNGNDPNLNHNLQKEFLSKIEFIGEEQMVDYYYLKKLDPEGIIPLSQDQKLCLLNNLTFGIFYCSCLVLEAKEEDLNAKEKEELKKNMREQDKQNAKEKEELKKNVVFSKRIEYRGFFFF